jgi:hypothetical protein
MNRMVDKSARQNTDGFREGKPAIQEASGGSLARLRQSDRSEKAC